MLRRISVVLMLLGAFSLFSAEKVKLGFFVREGETNLEFLKKVPTDLLVTFDGMIIFDSPIDEWIQKETEKDGKAPKVTTAGLQEQMLKSMDKVLKSGKPMRRIEDKAASDRQYLIVYNFERIVPVPMVSHTISARITIYDKAAPDTPVSVLTHQILDASSSIPGMVTDKGIGAAGANIAGQLKMFNTMPKAARSDEE